MAYLGNQPSNNFVSLKRQVITGNGGSTYTLDHKIASVNDCAIFVSNVRQDPASYSISNGNQLTLGGTISSSDSCYVIFLGQALQTVVPDANTITNAMIQDDAVTKDKVSNLMYPAFEANLSANQTIADAANVKVNMNTEVFDTDNMYDNSTNYRFTPTVAGKYFVYGSTRSGATADFNELDLMIRLNGTNIAHGGMRNEHSPYLKVFTVINMNGSSDYVELFGFQNFGGTQDFQGNSDRTYFGAYRIGT